MSKVALRTKLGIKSKISMNDRSFEYDNIKAYLLDIYGRITERKNIIVHIISNCEVSQETWVNLEARSRIKFQTIYTKKEETKTNSQRTNNKRLISICST